eukprot:8574385-Pyramimonas_sp.AAC.1
MASSSLSKYSHSNDRFRSRRRCLSSVQKLLCLRRGLHFQANVPPRTRFRQSTPMVRRRARTR